VRRDCARQSGEANGIRCHKMTQSVKGSSSFLKKRTKKLLSVGATPIFRAWAGSDGQQKKVFWFFFSKKNCFPAGLFSNMQGNLSYEFIH
jgi:hypothetical protein